MNGMNGNGQSLIHHPCTVCCRPTTMWCSRCQFAWYCSPEHLTEDWPRHRRECVAAPVQSSQVVIQTPPAAPEVMCVSAILFVPSQERPQIININCQLTRKPHASSCPTPLVDEFFQEAPPQALVLTQGLNGEPLRFPLHIFYCPMSLQRGTPVNRAIYRITSGAAVRHWPGPVVVLKFNGSRRQSYSDASTNDLPALDVPPAVRGRHPAYSAANVGCNLLRITSSFAWLGGLSGQYEILKKQTWTGWTCLTCSHLASCCCHSFLLSASCISSSSHHNYRYHRSFPWIHPTAIHTLSFLFSVPNCIPSFSNSRN